MHRVLTKRHAPGILPHFLPHATLPVQKCARSPKQASTADSLQAQLDTSGRRIKELEHDVCVLQKKLTVDAKLAKQAAATAARDREGLHRQMILQAADLEERNRYAWGMRV